MSHPRKYFAKGNVIFVTASLEQGLLLLSNPTCQKILKSCLARALYLYPVRLCHFIVHANHIHLIFVVMNPTDASNFMGHFKAEVAHRLNIVLGWKKRTIWCEGYDSPVVLSVIRALTAIAYLYANPAKDSQVDSIDKFPGLSSWNMFITGRVTAKWQYLRRPAFRFLPKDAHTLEGYTREANRLESESKSSHEFKLEPNAWLEAFGINDPEEQKKYNNRLIERVRTLEARARKVNKSVVGRNRLLRQALTMNYQPERTGKRMWCLSHSKEQRISFINMLKGLIAEACEVYTCWCKGDFSRKYPEGLFPPNLPMLVPTG